MNQISRSSEIVRMVSDGSFTEIIELIRDNLEKSRYVEPQWFNFLHTSATNFEANLKTQIGDEITERPEEKIDGAGTHDIPHQLRACDSRHSDDR